MRVVKKQKTKNHARYGKVRDNFYINIPKN